MQLSTMWLRTLVAPTDFLNSQEVKDKITASGDRAWREAVEKGKTEAECDAARKKAEERDKKILFDFSMNYAICILHEAYVYDRVGVSIQEAGKASWIGRADPMTKDTGLNSGQQISRSRGRRFVRCFKLLVEYGWAFRRGSDDDRRVDDGRVTVYFATSEFIELVDRYTITQLAEAASRDLGPVRKSKSRPLATCLLALVLATLLFVVPVPTHAADKVWAVAGWWTGAPFYAGRNVEYTAVSSLMGVNAPQIVNTPQIARIAKTYPGLMSYHKIKASSCQPEDVFAGLDRGAFAMLMKQPRWDVETSYPASDVQLGTDEAEAGFRLASGMDLSDPIDLLRLGQEVDKMYGDNPPENLDLDLLEEFLNNLELLKTHGAGKALENSILFMNSLLQDEQPTKLTKGAIIAGAEMPAAHPESIFEDVYAAGEKPALHVPPTFDVCTPCYCPISSPAPHPSVLVAIEEALDGGNGWGGVEFDAVYVNGGAFVPGLIYGPSVSSALEMARRIATGHGIELRTIPYYNGKFE